jgi:protein O-mannosyl-transferase
MSKSSKHNAKINIISSGEKGNKPYPGKLKSYKSLIIVLLLLIMAVTFAAYYPALNNKFTNWDDGGYIIDNLDLKNFNLEGIKNRFSHYFMGNYHPLALISLSADYAIDEMNPRQYHLTNIIFHLLNTLLVFWFILLLFTKNSKDPVEKKIVFISGIAALLFGIHTLNVESVAWVSERKTLLYTFFFLASIISYLEYLKSSKLKYYFLSIFLFLISLLSKGMAVSLSLTIIICDYFLERNLLSKKVIFEKIPFLLLSLVFGIITVYAQQSSNTIQFNTNFHFYERFLIGGYGFFQYLIKLILPVSLSFFYGYPDKTAGFMPVEYYLFPLFTLIILFVIIIYLRKNKTVIFGFSFFIVNIFMVLQLVPVGFAVMADRYAYIPAIGLFFVFAKMVKFVLDKYPRTITLISAFFTAYLILLAALTHERTKTWYDGFSLWNTEIEHNPNSALAYKNRGRMKEDINDFKGAYDDFNRAIMLNPGYGEAYNGRGLARGNMNDLKGAVEDLNKAIKFYPNDHLSWNNRGIARSMLKDYEGAISDFNKAASIEPGFYKAFYNRGLAKSSMGDHKGAIEDFMISLNIYSSQPDAWKSCGRERFFLKDYSGAIKDFDRCILISKNDGEIYYNRAVARYNTGNKAGACDDWNNSLRCGYSQSSEMLKRFCN